jgi:hypothetical protein
MLLIAPGEILIYSTFYKDVAYEYLYRIFGHYKYNFSFSLFENERLMVDTLCCLYDWAVVYLPYEVLGNMSTPISIQGGRNTTMDAYKVYQVLLMQLIFFYYFKNTNVNVVYAMTLQLLITLIGCLTIFDDDGLIGTTQFFTCPSLMLTILMQILSLSCRNSVTDVLSKIVITRYADLHNWYIAIFVA